MKRVGVEQADFRLAAYSIAGLMLMNDDPATAETLLELVFAHGGDPAQDKFISTYLLSEINLPIADGVTAQLTINRDAMGLALAELKQASGVIAIAVAERPEQCLQRGLRCGRPDIRP